MATLISIPFLTKTVNNEQKQTTDILSGFSSSLFLVQSNKCYC